MKSRSVYFLANRTTRSMSGRDGSSPSINTKGVVSSRISNGPWKNSAASIG